MQFIDKDKLIEVLKRIDGPTIDINILNGILETYGDTYFISNSEWELCKEGKKLETNICKSSTFNSEKITLIKDDNTCLHLGNGTITIESISNKKELPKWAQELTTGNVSEMRNIK